MKRRSSAPRWIAVALSTASVLCDAPSSARASAVAAPSPCPQGSDPRREMIAALWAPGPHASLGPEARVFDRFVGAWDSDYAFHAEDGSVRHATGEVLFGWIIDGRAMQDVWISHPRDGTKERNIGTSLRFFDDKARAWRVVFVSPLFGALLTVQGGVDGDRIVLRGADDEGAALRWSFNDIRADSFVWRGEKSRDGGKTWRLEEEHHMKRRTAAR